MRSFVIVFEGWVTSCLWRHTQGVAWMLCEI